jgi:DNA helicase HerA-like ATPase
VAEEVGGEYTPPPAAAGAVAYTHFDGPSSEDGHLAILIGKPEMDQLPSQTLVRIKSLSDRGEVDRTYLGVIVAGPFAEPDGLRADSPIVVATTVHGKIFLPRYHGRAEVQLLGEEANGQVVPPRFRPRPNSPVFPLDSAETAAVLKVGGDVRVGTVVGQDEIAVHINTKDKAVLPRHLGILGTTGGGKSTTVSGLVHSLQKAGVATILLDVEGEYPEMDRPTEHEHMKAALELRGMTPEGTKELRVYHLFGRETSRGEGPQDVVRPFCLRFDELSPYAVMEILELNDAQRDRFYLAYDTARLLLKDLGVFPRLGANKRADEERLLNIDLFDEGYPHMTLSLLIDVAGAILHKVAKNDGLPPMFNDVFKSAQAQARVEERVNAAAVRTSHEGSWRAVLARLWAVHRPRVFDNPGAESMNYTQLIAAGRVSVIDLSDTNDSPVINNLVIANVLRGVQQAQEAAVATAQADSRAITPVVIIIEEAHEFLSKQRIGQMATLFQQVARIAKRGRKRWLSLVFVTQLPQHLPDEVLGLLNNFVLHKISDASVVERLRKSISGLDKGQWGMVPGLAPGQALVSLASMTRPLLVAVDPTPSHLRLTN